MKRLISVLLCTATLFTVTTGCSKSESTKPETSKQPDAITKKVDLTYWTTTNRKDWTEAAIKAYTADHPNVTITGTYDVVDNLRKNLKVAASSGTLPSIWYQYGGNYFAYYTENGLSYDLTQYAKDNDWANKMDAGTLQLCTLNGKVAGYPQVLTTFGAIYNKELFDKLSIKTPTNFQEFEAALATLKKNNVIPLAIGGKNGWMLMRLTDILLEKYAGPEEHDKLNALTGDWSQEAVVKAFANLKKWTDAGYLPDGFVTTDPNDARMLLYTGKAAITIDGAPLSQMMANNKVDFSKFTSFRIETDTKGARMPTYVTMLQYNAKLNSDQFKTAMAFSDVTLSKNASFDELKAYPLPFKGEVFPEKFPLIQPLQKEFETHKGFVTGDNALVPEVASYFYQADEAVVGGSMTPAQAAAFMQDKIKAYKATNK